MWPHLRCTVFFSITVLTTADFNRSLAVDDKDRIKVVANMPVSLTSFGGAVIENKLYVYGGHAADAHDYYNESQNTNLYALDLANPGEWKMLNTGTGLQGLAMVAHGRDLYRLGGFTARNHKGEPQDLHSVSEFARFDFTAGIWEQLEPMPVARSSFDAVVVGDLIYVIGGWTLAGEGNTKWCEDAYAIDVSQSRPVWQRLPQPPFKRRALSLGFVGDDIFIIGGMQERGGPTRDVTVFNTQTQTYSKGPEIPGDQEMEGFGNSCFNVGGKLIVSTYSGAVLKLDDEGTNWVQFNQLETGRFFHRLLPALDHQFLLVGGANMDSGKIDEIVQLKVGDPVKQ